MPRASKMARWPANGQATEYWPEVGPLTIFIKDKQIVKAVTVDPEVKDYDYERLQDVHQENS